MAKSRDNEQETENASQLADKIKDSARQIWLAGLGAYTKAEEDAGRFFERLVHEGEEIESRTRGAVERQIRSVEGRVEEVKEKATGTWDRLESVFDQRVSRTLQRLGIPTREEVAALKAQIETLEAELKTLKQAKPKAASGKGTKSK
ncbi:phasin family protein [Mangrovitalea sediminis]|uniref:phasin family protein n=1 Tax=Mangrovitalea sediminis TaxID=1982043 RepID=UPI000BE54115|nr:phasin family protein [Mangrovitalea sediminis]